MQHAILFVCTLLAATSQLSILIGQKMQLTGLDDCNDMLGATCADTQTSLRGPAIYSLCYAVNIVRIVDGNENKLRACNSLCKKNVLVKITFLRCISSVLAT